MAISKSLLAGKNMANEKSVFIPWVLFGFAIAIIAIPVAHLKRPEMDYDVLLLIEDNDEIDKDAFEMAYIDEIKKKRIVASWVGFVVAIIVFAVFPI